jgi:hypothetical protein
VGRVAIILNKEIVKSAPTHTENLIPGRAILTNLKWTPDNQLSILAVYVPNITHSGHENTEFWENINHLTANKEINIMIGDFNMVENALDRLPQHPDADIAIEALQKITNTHQLSDGWRITNPPPTRNFTFRHSTANYMSRIDRIYADDNILDKAFTWDILDPEIPTTDHQLTIVSIHNPNIPIIGCGRWAMPKYLINDKDFLKEVERMGNETLTQINHQETTNTQQQFQHLILTITNLAKKTRKDKIRKNELKNQKTHE